MVVMIEHIDERRFNLVDEKWIPAAGIGSISLREAFAEPSPRFLGGNPVEKISVLKLLLAICQTAWTPQDDDEWRSVDAIEMGKKCIAYLDAHLDDFWLYGEKPFLQVPEIKTANKLSCGALLPYVATGNTTVLLQSHMERELSDAEKAILVTQLMGFALGGKKADNSVVLSPGYTGKSNDKGKPSTGKPGPSLGFFGQLHSFILGDDLLSTIRLNILTHEDISSQKIFEGGLGIPPWEASPQGEDCPRARALKNTLIGRLLPFSRFTLLADGKIHYSEGVLHPGYKDGIYDPSMAIDVSGREPKTLWVDPEKRPWRSLTSLLSFLEAGSGGMRCPYLVYGLRRARKSEKRVGVWSGGLSVSSNAGEQYASGSDDYVESEVTLESGFLETNCYMRLKEEMEALESASRTLYGAVIGYHKKLMGEGDKAADVATNTFWQLCEREFQVLITACGNNEPGASKALRPVFARIAESVYSGRCPKDTARQLDAWADNRPRLGWYLYGDQGKKKSSRKDEKQ